MRRRRKSSDIDRCYLIFRANLQIADKILLL